MTDSCSHLLDLSNVITHANLDENADSHAQGPHGPPRTIIAARDDDAIPHIRCDRCGHIWAVCPTPGNTYNQAVQALHEHVTNPPPLETE